MKSRSLRAPAHATVVAYLALFLALGGSAYAATKLPANSVGTKQIKDNAVTGAKVKESTLAQVPSAKSATHAASAGTSTTAANATDLGGQPASSFLRTTSVQRIDVDQPDCVNPTDAGCTETALNAAGFVVQATCADSSDGEQHIHVIEVPEGSVGGGFGVLQHGPPIAASYAPFSAGSVPWELIDAVGSTRSGVPFGGSWIFRSAAHTLTITGLTLMSNNTDPASTSCIFYGTAVVT